MTKKIRNGTRKFIKNLVYPNQPDKENNFQNNLGWCQNQAPSSSKDISVTLGQKNQDEIKKSTLPAINECTVRIALLSEKSERQPCLDDTKRRIREIFQRIANRITFSHNTVTESLSNNTITQNNAIKPAINDNNLPVESPKRLAKCFKRIRDMNQRVIDPHGFRYFVWLFLVSFAYIYNLVVIPLRASFLAHSETNIYVWLTFDIICDMFYICDTVFAKPKVSFLHQGSMVQDTEETSKYYRKQLMFKMDVIASLPTEFLYLYFGKTTVLLRLPRLLKFQTFSLFYASMDKMLSSPLIIRVARTLIYTFYLIHLNACAYYKVSDIEGIGSNGWVYNGQGNSYIRCFYFATKVSTSIGKNSKPEKDFEYVYMTFAWLMGVCVFALLIGQIRYFITTATKSETEYRNLLAESLKCMRQLNIPCELQNKVISWFTYTWKQQRTLDDTKALSALPANLLTEVAMNMHMQTLNKVKLFNDCDPALLRDLVLKLKSVIYLPGDVICRRGDVGKEMYIIKSGRVEVIGGLNNNEVLASLSEGSVFGEISLLNINGMNRRTADVRSALFCNIFVLNKADFDSVVAYYPEALQHLHQKANELINQNAARDKTNSDDNDVNQDDADDQLAHQRAIICEVNGSEIHELHETIIPNYTDPCYGPDSSFRNFVFDIPVDRVRNKTFLRSHTGTKKYNLYRTARGLETSLRLN